MADAGSRQPTCSRRANQMPPFLVMEVLERAADLQRQGRSVIHLEVGEPDFDTPVVAVEAGERALRDGRTHYTHSLGHPELREAISAWHHRQYGLQASPDCIVVTAGSSGAMLLVFAALLDPGAEVLITDPHYACYPNFISAFEGVPVRTPVREVDGFQFDPQAVKDNLGPKTKALVLNSPANPTGTLTQPERMKELVELLGDRVVIISDEIYHGLVYRGRAHSIREFTPNAVVINGFSKLFAMTGWRLGYAIVPDWLVRPIQKLQQNLFISAPDFPQFAGIAALENAGEDVERMRQCYDQRRQLVLRRLKEMGLDVLTEPVGAFYVFVNVRHYTDDVYKFAFEILESTGVAVTPGVDFGPGGQGYIRISYANSLENIDEGMNRLEKFLAERPPRQGTHDLKSG
ncbi:MAG: pyridoxal phosphate-dependent aminotransferase [Phycisphaerales bacterium]|nr:MAG: pyridoxal phosphate-dependent aminotransferase [Phycisphaerales bacterium]